MSVCSWALTWLRAKRRFPHVDLKQCSRGLLHFTGIYCITRGRGACPVHLLNSSFRNKSPEAQIYIINLNMMSNNAYNTCAQCAAVEKRFAELQVIQSYVCGSGSAFSASITVLSSSLSKLSAELTHIFGKLVKPIHSLHAGSSCRLTHTFRHLYSSTGCRKQSASRQRHVACWIIPVEEGVSHRSRSPNWQSSHICLVPKADSLNAQ